MPTARHFLNRQWRQAHRTAKGNEDYMRCLRGFIEKSWKTDSGDPWSREVIIKRVFLFKNTPLTFIDDAISAVLAGEALFFHYNASEESLNRES